MTYLDKYYSFRAKLTDQLLLELKEKGYDQTTKWFKEDEDECYSDDRYNLPRAYIGHDDAMYLYFIVRWDGESFLCYNHENMEYWIEIEDIDLLNLCKILDHINEQN